MGPQGPPGTGSYVPPAPPPTPYAGGFSMSINGANDFLLTAFAGCYEKVIGVEYEDCHFTTERLAPGLIDWLQDTIAAGANGFRNVTIYQFTQQDPTQAVSRLEITDAFIKEFQFSAGDGSTPDPATMSFVIVPREVRTSGATAIGSTLNAPRVLMRDFRFTLPGMETKLVTGVSSLRLKWGTIRESIGFSRVAYLPDGLAPVIDNLTVQFAASMNLGNLNSWLRDVGMGIIEPRDGTLEFLNATLSTPQIIFELLGLYPIYFPPFPTSGDGTFLRREITFKLNSIIVQ
jgi:hypothetical protein